MNAVCEFNYSKLRGRIVEILGTQASFAGEMGWSERSVSEHLNGGMGWRQSDVVKACDILSINKNDIGSYFYAYEVKMN